MNTESEAITKPTNKIIDSKVLIIDDFLSLENLGFILKSVEEKQKVFEISSFIEEEEKTVDKKRRKSMLIEKESFENIYSLLINQLMNFQGKLVEEFDCNIDITTEYFCQLVASNDGDFFIPHRDNVYGANYINKSKTTAVFYFHREPKNFKGGEFFIWDRFQDSEGNFLEEVPSQGALIEPLNNRLIVFEGDCLHEAMEVKCESREFMDSRFCVVMRLP